MFTVPVEVAPSTLDGKGVFSVDRITNGVKVWVFEAGKDLRLTPAEYNALPASKKKSIELTGYLSPWSGFYIFPPDGDPARYTNHSPQNNLTAVYDATVSSEPFFVANRDIKPGEELTNNYLEFDEIARTKNPRWLH